MCIIDTRYSRFRVPCGGSRKNQSFSPEGLVDAAIAAINDTIPYKHRGGRLTAGAVVVLHPFAKIMGFNPRPRILVTEGDLTDAASSYAKNSGSLCTIAWKC